MRRRQLKGLWARLKELRRMSVNLTRDELLIKLGGRVPTGGVARFEQAAREARFP